MRNLKLATALTLGITGLSACASQQSKPANQIEVTGEASEAQLDSIAEGTSRIGELQHDIRFKKCVVQAMENGTKPSNARATCAAIMNSQQPDTTRTIELTKPTTPEQEVNKISFTINITEFSVTQLPEGLTDIEKREVIKRIQQLAQNFKEVPTQIEGFQARIDQLQAQIDKTNSKKIPNAQKKAIIEVLNEVIEQNQTEIKNLERKPRTSTEEVIISLDRNTNTITVEEVK